MNSTSLNVQFTIFLPVKNGGAYLPLCVESILTQRYPGFELVILENQSSDGTAEWLQILESKDTRIKVIPSESSLSIEENWKRILTVPKNNFMTIIGHDDLFEPDFLEEIKTLIKSEPTANLYQTHFKLIDDEGKLIRHCKPIPKYETASEFLAARMAEIRDSFGTGYVMRSEHYDKIGGIPPFGNLLYADDALWVGLMGNSFKVTSPRICFSYRLHMGSISGKPNQESLLEGLRQYMEILCELAKCNADIARTVEIYASQYVFERCRSYYYHIPLFKRVDFKKLSEIEFLLNKYSPQKKLDKKYIKFFKKAYRKSVALLTKP